MTPPVPTPAAAPAAEPQPGRGLAIAGFWAVTPGAVLLVVMLFLNDSIAVLGLIPYLLVALPAAFIGLWLAVAGLVLLRGRHGAPRSGAVWGWVALAEVGVLVLVVLGSMQ